MQDRAPQVKFQVLRVVNGRQQQIGQGVLLLGLGEAQGCGQVALGIVIHQQNFLARSGQRRAQIQGCSGLANTAFLVGYG